MARIEFVILYKIIFILISAIIKPFKWNILSWLNLFGQEWFICRQSVTKSLAALIWKIFSKLNWQFFFFRNNRLTKLEAHTFKGCPKLRELSLSFNNLESMDDLSFKDIGGSLESLEISFGLLMRIFPESALKPLQKLLWLSLDNNEIEEIFLCFLLSFVPCTWIVRRWRIFPKCYGVLSHQYLKHFLSVSNEWWVPKKKLLQKL